VRYFAANYQKLGSIMRMSINSLDVLVRLEQIRDPLKEQNQLTILLIN